MRIADIMTRDVTVARPETTLREAAREMADIDAGSLPVCDGRRLLGIVTDRDIVVRGIANDRPPSTTAVRDVMSEKVFYCFENDDVEDAAQLMAEHQVRRIPVLNREKRLVGMLSLADLGMSGAAEAKRALQGVSQPTDAPRQM